MLDMANGRTRKAESEDGLPVRRGKGKRAPVSVQLIVRVTLEDVRRLDHLAHDSANPDEGYLPSRIDALRLAMRAGLDAHEKQRSKTK
jgi:hypothetical protein